MTDPTIHVLVVDDHEMFVESLVRLLEDEPDVRVAGVAFTAKDAVREAQRLQPTVVLLDFRLPDADAPDCMARLSEVAPRTPVLVMSGFGDDATAAAAQRGGAAGIIIKSRPAEELLAALRAVAAGEVGVGDERWSRRSRSSARDATALSQRELEVLGLAASGLSNAEIAAALHLSYNTVRNHMRHIITKLGAHSRLEAVTTAVRRHIIAVPAEPRPSP